MQRKFCLVFICAILRLLKPHFVVAIHVFKKNSKKLLQSPALSDIIQVKIEAQGSKVAHPRPRQVSDGVRKGSLPKPDSAAEPSGWACG